ncbi:DUF2712 domain-containing protein [Listeria valentina]|uniref:DUF2712 domain-containing protein n=1 Tax=Listeria valentina TaxID=2705293 RepID=UPI00143224B9|nr:DUF2712 domain-containing protein [Listeria valentina]
MLKRILAVSFGMVLIAGSFGIVNVNAVGNTGDTTFNLRLAPSKNDPDYDHTKFRKKNNTSAVYMKVNYVKNNKNKVSAWVLGGNGWTSKNCSGGNYYSAHVRGIKKMTNYVREEGRTSASIKAGADPKHPNNVEGAWSPDSRR